MPMPSSGVVSQTPDTHAHHPYSILNPQMEDGMESLETKHIRIKNCIVLFILSALHKPRRSLYLNYARYTCFNCTIHHIRIIRI